MRYQYCSANKLRGSFSRCLNAEKCRLLFCSFCTSVYASQLWCNFRKAYMQRMRVAYNFGFRALHNLPWRASVSSHQARRNIPTFEKLLWKSVYLFLKRCRKSNNVWFCFDAAIFRLFTFFLILWTLQPHFTLSLSARTLQCLFEGVCMPQHICTSPGLDQVRTQCPTLDVVLYQAVPSPRGRLWWANLLQIEI